MNTTNNFLVCYICNKVIPFNLQVEHHKIPKSAGGTTADLVYLHAGCHDDMHKVANIVFNGNEKAARDTAYSVYPASVNSQQRMMELAILVAKYYRAKKEGSISVSNNIMEIKLDLTTQERTALFTLARDHSLSVRKFVTAIIKKEIYSKYPVLRKK